jgi:hypothetical protein
MTRDGGQRGNIKEDARAGCMYVTLRPMASSSVASPCSYESFASRRHTIRSTRGTNQGAWLHSAGRVDD